MPRFPVGRGSPEADIFALQVRLNRIGSILSEDGRWGGETLSALHFAQAQCGSPLGDTCDGALWNWLEQQPEPSSDLSASAIAFIARHEIGSRKQYLDSYHRPTWPGDSSGITIGIGYDLRMQSENFKADWADYIDAATIDRLDQPRYQGIGSKELEAELKDISIPLETAWECFIERTLPSFVAQAQGAFPEFEERFASCRGALVSLVYNRGPSMKEPTKGRTRKHMRDIRDHLASGQPNLVAQDFRDMASLWPVTSGVHRRRLEEAALWERGLTEAKSAVSV